MKWEEVGKRIEEEEVEEEEGGGRRGGGGLPFGRWWGVNDLDSMKSVTVPPRALYPKHTASFL